MRPLSKPCEQGGGVAYRLRCVYVKTGLRGPLRYAQPALLRLGTPVGMRDKFQHLVLGAALRDTAGEP